MAELRFHRLHGANICLSEDRHVARRLQGGFANGLVFSDRPVRINERVSIKLLQLSDSLSNMICFGFTSKNPLTLAEEIQCCYHDLCKSDYWIWPMFKAMCRKDSILFYYVTKDGHVHFGIDGREIDFFYKKVQTGGPLWAVLDLDGESSTVELLAGEEEGEESEEAEEDVETLEEVDEDRLCTVCCQKEINAVLYKCGHMCMCYQCGIRQKQGAGNGHCPLCRALIIDVIRTYR